MNKVLVVAPHADDETLGCGGTLLRHKKNKDEVNWLVMTKLSKELGYTEKQIIDRDIEIKKISKLYKFNKYFQGNFETTKLDTFSRSDLIEFASNVINKVKPNIIYLPFKHDIHSDHTIVFDTFAASTKTFRYPFIKKILVYETISETEIALETNNVFKPNLFVDISKYLDEKIKIMKIFKSEVGHHPFPRSEKNIRALATFRGSMANVKAAESFMLLKEII